MPGRRDDPDIRIMRAARWHMTQNGHVPRIPQVQSLPGFVFLVLGRRRNAIAEDASEVKRGENGKLTYWDLAPHQLVQ